MGNISFFFMLMMLICEEKIQKPLGKNAEIFIKSSKGIGLEVNCEKTKCMIRSRRQNVIQNQNIVIGNLSFENMEKFRYLGVTVTNTNDIREEIKRRINMGNACNY